MNVLQVVVTLVLGLSGVVCYESSDGCPKSMIISVSVNENEKAGTILYNISGVSHLQFLGEHNYTRIENQSDIYLIKTSTILDYEKLTHKGLTFNLLCDDIQYTFVLRVLNIIEVLPSFEKTHYSCNISENTAIGTTLINFVVRNPENVPFNYKTTPSFNQFEIDASSNKIKLHERLNYNNQSVYRFDLTIEGLDGSNTVISRNTTTVVIYVSDWDDKPPAFTQLNYTVKVKENAAVNSIWKISTGILAFDQDKGINDTIYFSVLTEFPEPAFGISTTNGSLILNKPLDREKIDKYQMLIKAYQKDKPDTRMAAATVEVQILDINDNKPIMSQQQYNLSIVENTPDNTQIIKLSATDKDTIEYGKFEYILSDGTDAFQIDAKTGMISVKNSSYLDREKKTYFHLQAYAKETNTSERHESNKTVVRIDLLDENDNSPKFDKERYEISRKKTVNNNTVLIKVNASDPDFGANGKIIYSLSGDDLHTERFFIDNTGSIKVIKSLSDDFKQEYDFFAVATDSAVPLSIRRTQTVPVKINVFDVNINPPKFLTVPPVSIKEDLQIESHIIYVKAYDKDFNDSLEYEIKSGNTAGGFKINSTSGEITLANSLDREKIPHYHLTVSVTDGKFNDTTGVNITILDINDNPPHFVKDSYTCNVKEGQSIARVFDSHQANDSDVGNNSTITYSISSIWQKNFTIDNNTGEVHTFGILDRENPIYMELGYLKITVSARDHGSPSLSSQVDVKVHISDINDNAPYFKDPNVTVTAFEEEKRQIFISQAQDADTGSNADIKYRLKSGDSSFSVISDGRVEILHPLKISDKDSARHVIEIEAYNTKAYEIPSLKNATQTVTVIVKDVNNHYPVFTDSVYNFTVKENETIGTTLTGLHKINATDADIDQQFNTIKYWLHGEGNEYFSIDSTTGLLKIARPLDYERKESFNFKVYASDMQPNYFNNTIINVTKDVSIKVEDVNDNKPKFTQAGRLELISIARIRKFITGSQEKPILGFSIMPSLNFSEDGMFPTSNTCLCFFL